MMPAGTSQKLSVIAGSLGFPTNASVLLGEQVSFGLISDAG